MVAVTIGEKISHLSIKVKVSLMELSCDTSLKMKFEALSLPEFWVYIKRTLGMTYLCEKIFSAMAAFKSK
jgi:hypothetical protein